MTFAELETQRGHVYTVADYRLIMERSRTRPASLNEDDLLVIEFFVGARHAQVARAARDDANWPAEVPRPDTDLPDPRRPAQYRDLSLLWSSLRQEIAAAVPTTATLAETIAEAITSATAPLQQEISDLKTQIVELSARPGVQDAGVWRSGGVYNRGDVVSHDGSGWICSMTHAAAGTAPSHDCFRLLVKRGRDAR